MMGYLIAVAAVLEGVVLSQRKTEGSQQLFREGAVIEWMQFGLLMTSSVVLFAAAARCRPSRELYRIMAFFPLMAAIREMDYQFDRLAGRGIWGLTCIAAGMTAVFLAARGRKVLKEQFRRLVAHRSFGYMASAVVLVLAISRIIGQKVFWKSYLGDEKYTRDVPRAVEELGELSGYLLLACGVLELYFTAKRTVVDKRRVAVEERIHS